MCGTADGSEKNEFAPPLISPAVLTKSATVVEMDAFSVLAVRTLNEKYDRLKKRIVKKCGILPKDLYMIVLEYSQIRDTWLTTEHFNTITISTDHASGRDIQIVHDVVIGPYIEITMELLPNADSPDITKIQFIGPVVELYDYLLDVKPDITVHIKRPNGLSTNDREQLKCAFELFMVELLIWSK